MTLKPEEREQIALIEWAHLHDDIWPYLIHIRNEGKRSIYEGAKAKRMGLMKGVSDLFFAQGSKLHEWDFSALRGFWIELKSAKGKPTSDQLEFLRRMKTQGYHTGIYYCWIDAAKAICEYIRKKPNGL